MTEGAMRRHKLHLVLNAMLKLDNSKAARIRGRKLIRAADKLAMALGNRPLLTAIRKINSETEKLIWNDATPERQRVMIDAARSKIHSAHAGSQ